MNVDRILETMNRHQVGYILIGGMNFLLRHEPVLTFDVDLWIEDTDGNRSNCEEALAELDAEWGSGDDDWKLVRTLPGGWLARQSVYCLTSPHGAIDIFRDLKGPKDWKTARQNAILEQTTVGVGYPGLSDKDMLECQFALETRDQKPDRIRVLKRATHQ